MYLFCIITIIITIISIHDVVRRASSQAELTFGVHDEQSTCKQLEAVVNYFALMPCFLYYCVTPLYMICNMYRLSELNKYFFGDFEGFDNQHPN